MSKTKINPVLNLFDNDGTIIDVPGTSHNDVHFDFAQVELIGKHVKNIDTNNNIMLVSALDMNSVLKYKWYLTKTGYPGTYGTVDNNIKYSRPVHLHQMLYPNTPKGYVIDHINRNRLDNRRDNLRICTPIENSYNKSKPSNSNHKYKGVKAVGKKNLSYVASVTKDGIKREIRGIQTEKGAARIYDMMVDELFGVYAAKNFPDKVV
jgi:hypothetical protein